MDTWYELISQYGYFAIFGLLTLGIIGLPVPDEFVLTYLGYVTYLGDMSFVITVISALLGAICGISISYLLGVKLGEPFIKKFGTKLFISEKVMLRTNKLFHKYGSLVLFICYFIPGVRHIAAYIGGISRYSFKRFALFAYSGAFVWVMLFLVLGNRLGNNWEVIIYFSHKYMWSMLIIVIIIGLPLYYYYQTRRQRIS